MNSLSTIQIILYILTAISSVVALFNTFKNEDIKRSIKIVTVVLIIVSLGLSVVHESLKADKDQANSEKREQDHKQYIDSLSKIISKSDSTLKTQDAIQKRTDSLLIKSNQMSEETQNVLSNTVSVLDNQEKTLEDEERKRNPLFPMDLEITLKLSLRHAFFKRVIDSIYHYKNSIENAKPYDKKDIQINWSGNTKKVSTLILRDFEKFIRRNDENENQEFYKYYSVLNFSIMLYTNFSGDLNQLFKSIPIFYATTNKQVGAIHGVSDFEYDFESKTAYLIARFTKLTFLPPTPKGTIGVSDLFNHYLVFFAEDGMCYSELIRINMEIGRPIQRAWIQLNMDQSNSHTRGKNKDCKIFIKKIYRNEMMIPVQPSD